MTRKQATQFLFLIICCLILAAVIIGTSPLWFTVLMINPRASDTVTQFVMSRITREVTRFMFRSAPRRHAA
jgi:hypothetical protein